jgi:O-antigen ligase
LAAGLFYLVLGYLLVRGIVSRATRAETQEFLAAVVIVNTIACALFILDQGLHLPIYLGQANITYTYGGQAISRATTFAPVFNLLTLGFVLAKRRWTPGWLVVLAITLLAILVSLTRTLLIAAVFGLLIAIIAREFTRPDFNRVLRRIGTIALGMAIIVVGFSRMAPAYWSFLLKRFSEFTSGKTGAQIMNWHLRVIHWDAVQRVVARADLAFGLGFPKPGSNPVDGQIFSWSSDMTWVPILYHFGYLGLVLFGLLLAGFMVRALLVSLKPPELRRELSLAYFITLALTVVMGFQMWTFMMPLVYPMGLWIFAFAAAETLRPADEPDLLPAPAHGSAAATDTQRRPRPQPL